jgi:hypothetical protein
VLLTRQNQARTFRKKKCLKKVFIRFRIENFLIRHQKLSPAPQIFCHSQGCQMAYVFSYQKVQIGKILEGLAMEDVGLL